MPAVATERLVSADSHVYFTGDWVLIGFPVRICGIELARVGGVAAATLGAADVVACRWRLFRAVGLGMRCRSERERSVCRPSSSNCTSRTASW